MAVERYAHDPARSIGGPDTDPGDRPAPAPDHTEFDDETAVEPGVTAAPVRRRRGRAVFAGAMVGALLVGAGSSYALTRHPSTTTVSAPPPPGTATVSRQNLVNTEQEPGTLAYTGSYTVVGQSALSGNGTGSGGAGTGGGGTGGGAGNGASGSGTRTITWLPTVGTVVKEGQQLYGADGHPVPLLYGSIPLYRTLQSGVSDGEDVRELNQALRALGYHDAPSGDTFTAGTAQAVQAWQKSLGVTRTGAVNPGDAVFEPGAVVITAVSASPGAAVTGTLMTLSSTAKAITVNLPVASQSLARPGASVSVQLPDGSTAPGHVTSIGSVAVDTGGSGGNGSGGGSGSGSGGNGSGSGSGSGSGGSNAAIPVTVTLDDPSAGGNLDDAPVTVSFTSAERDGVLAVPVGALLALAGGGYAIDVVDPGGHTRLLAVRLGMFANGEVEVSGPGVREGLKVEVASTE